MARDLIIGIDAGTTACKLLAVRADGHIQATSSSDYPLHSPRQGQAVQDAREVWQGVQQACNQLVRSLDADRIAGVCFSGAMHSLLPVDDKGQPLMPAMTWADLRAVDAGDALRAQDVKGDVYAATGCPLRWPYWPAKLQWLARHERDTFDRATQFVGIKDWLIHQFTGEWVTGISMASATGLLDLRSHQWHPKALTLAGIDASRLPVLAKPQAIIGELSKQAAALTGLPQGIAVMPGGGDGGLANIGAGGALPGSIVATVGTSGAVRMTASEPLLDSRQRTWCYVMTEDRWYAGGAINNGGLAVETIRRMFFADVDKDAGFEALFSEAATIAPGCEGVLLRPYFAGERSPHWRPDLRASMHGLTGAHSRAHIARAVLEGVAYCLADVWHALRSAGATQPRQLRLTGGITKSRFWSQIVCDVLNVPVTLSEAGDASALGAAAIGHWGAGHVATIDAFAIDESDQITLTPSAENQSIYQDHWQDRWSQFTKLNG